MVYQRQALLLPGWSVLQFLSSIAEDQTSYWLIIYISFTLMHQSFSILCPFLARHEVFISSLVGAWRQNEGERWTSSNHWGKFILKTIGLGALFVYYHGLIWHTNMNQVPGSIRFHLSQMMVMDSTGILLNPRYFTVRECSWGISNKQEKSNRFLLCFPHFMHFNHTLEAWMCLLFTGGSAQVTCSCRGGDPGKWETPWWCCKDGRI